ncbi:PEP-CTERM sorting domain-containing protein [Nitrogeniibacter aestuarii]|uniref:PEP-CTERM sorting domain-containing protein n=1 Tax=Nitrogeniibacter aestuarii TaxID=2815343 RepID=UPI001D11B856|nr:PEP-CTERM sorting domain-containing protein [Nitrogeniibacter aestuarii]
MKKLSAIAAGLLVSGVVSAAPLTLQPGPLYFQFNNVEQLNTNNGIVVPGGSIDVNGDGILDTPATEGNWGVFNISSIQSGAVATPNQDISGGSTYFADDGLSDIFGQGQVSGIFYGLTLTSGTTATGGWIDLYWEDAADDDITNADLSGANFPGRTAANQAGIFTDGTFLARLKFDTGIISGDNTTTLVSDVDLTTLTGSGLADSFGSVVDINNDGVINSLDGEWAGVLNSDWFFVDTNGNGIFGEDGETRDLRFSTFFNLLPNTSAWADPANGTVALRSNDPGRAFVVPEPGSLALLGLGVLGLAGARRRKSA